MQYSALSSIQSIEARENERETAVKEAAAGGGARRDQAGRSVTDERAVTWGNPAAIQNFDTCSCACSRSGRIWAGGLTIGAC